MSHRTAVQQVTFATFHHSFRSGRMLATGLAPTSSSNPIESSCPLLARGHGLRVTRA